MSGNKKNALIVEFNIQGEKSGETSIEKERDICMYDVTGLHKHSTYVLLFLYV